MGTEFFELCHETLAGLLKERALTQAKLAQRLSISKKTIQRWVNRTTRRVSRETLLQLASALETSAETLIRSAEKIQIRPFNSGLKELTAEDYLLKVRLTADWSTYRRILASYIADDLPSPQQAILFKNLGIASLYVGKLRAGKTYLEKSINIAKTLDDQKTQALAHSWLAVREEINGDLFEARVQMQRAEQLIAEPTCYLSRSTSSFIKGRIAFHSENYEDAIKYTRLAISEIYKSEIPGSLVMSSVFYLHLAWTHLRQRNFKKAQTALHRAQLHAERVGWVRGQAIVHLSYAMISRFQKQACPLVEGRLKKGRALNRLAPRRPLDTRLEQIEFIHHILAGDYEKAKENVLMRLSWTLSCNLYTSYIILDCLFLAKLSPQTLLVRPSLIEKAQKVFRDNQLKESQGTLELLLKSPSITVDDFLTHYMF